MLGTGVQWRTYAVVLGIVFVGGDQRKKTLERLSVRFKTCLREMSIGEKK
jgi:hypothetical protein